LYQKAGQPLKHVHPWESAGKVAGVAFGIPLVALLVGWSLLWAFSGFLWVEAKDHIHDPLSVCCGSEDFPLILFIFFIVRLLSKAGVG
jgi:hypothetical protein